jgi:hypothetical protein
MHAVCGWIVVLTWLEESTKNRRASWGVFPMCILHESSRAKARLSGQGSLGWNDESRPEAKSYESDWDQATT